MVRCSISGASVLANPTEEIQEKINQVIFSIYDLTDDEIEVVLKR